jgi:hypothetical protein
MPQTKRQPAPTLRYDPKASRYRSERGTFVSRATVLEARDAIVRDTSEKLRRISEQYRDGKISLAEWQTTFKDTIKAAHTLSAGIAMGGKANMAQSDWGKIGQQLRVQYEALNRFALQLEGGATINLGRVEQYARAVRSTFINAETLRQPATRMARWVRTRAESCAGCVEQAARGKQPLRSFPPIGSRQCRHACKCFLEYL